jgi:hypothetical protein
MSVVSKKGFVGRVRSQAAVSLNISLLSSQETGSPLRSACSFSATLTPLLTIARCLCWMTYFCGELKENVNQFKL